MSSDVFMELVGVLFLFFILILLSAFFSGIEIAFFSLSAHRIRSMKQRKLKGVTAVEKLKKRPHRLLATILVGNNLVNIFIASLASVMAVSLFGSIGIGIATMIITAAILIFGEILPKAFATVYAGNVARRGARFILILETILYPIVLFLEGLTTWLIKHIAGSNSTPYTVEEDIKSLMQIGYEKGTVERFEQSFVERLFLFDDKPISKVMMPIGDVFMFYADDTIHSVEHQAIHSGYSRFPIYKETRTHISGIVHIKDIVSANNTGHGDESIETIMTPPISFVSNSKVDDVFLEMRKKKCVYAVVVTDSGKLVGIITLEDIIEELIGEIHDEYDMYKRKAS